MNTKSNILYSTLFSLLCLVASNSQVTSNSHVLKDSTNYSELKNSLLSKNGKTAIIHKYYKYNSNKDSVFIFKNGKLKLTKQTNAPYIELKNNMLTTYHHVDKQLEILNPTTLKEQIVSNVSELITIAEHNLIFYLEKNTEIFKLSKILNNNITEIWSSPKELINFTSVSKDKKTLLIQYKDLEKGIELINLSNLKSTINKEVNYSIKNCIWDIRYPIVFLSPKSIDDNKHPYLIFYNYKTNFTKIQYLDEVSSYNIPESLNDYSFKIIQNTPIEDKPYDTKELELWSTNDHHLSQIILFSKAKKKYLKKNLIFDYSDNKFYQPKTLNNHESIYLNNNELLIHNPYQYLDYTYMKSAKIRDISTYDIKKNKISLISKKQQDPLSTTSLSPKRNYLIYTKENIIHIYNLKNNEIENTFNTKEDTNNSFRSFPRQLKYWSEDEKFFYFTSYSNLIQYNTQNKSFKIIINGDNTDSRYKIINSFSEEIYKATNDIKSISISNYNTLLIEKFNPINNTQSLFLLDEKGLKWIIKDTECRISNIKYSDDFRTISYSLENFNKPKSVYIFQNGKNILLLEDTISKEFFSWQKQRIVSYKDKYGNNLKGVLFYPKNFDSNKKYPMITHIYEIQSQLANIFTYPTYLNSDGFNITLLQENNYFVFLPDILDTEQGTGLSALHCVEESIKTVLHEEKSIDKDNLGLFGFSHGGYETNFIITQTDIFKAAVSGSGNSDIIRSYFSYNENFNSPFFFQFENGQYKMPKTLKEDKELFLKNSPILFADQIKTPLLSFTGKKDENIHWEQQREFFIALLRYNIPHVALFYSNEGHGLSKKENRIDITKRLINWFDYFLKNKETKWIKHHTSFNNQLIINN